MSLITKVKTVTGIIVVAVVAAVAMHVNPSAFTFTGTGDDDNYLLSVTWLPANGTQKTHIEVKVDGATLMIRQPRLSPWGETAIIAKGARVTLTASRHIANLSMLDCMIMRNNRTVPGPGYKKIEGPGTVECAA